MDLLVVRHGKTDWNAEQRVMGRNDVPINAQGVAQAKNLRDWLAEIRIDAVYSSPIRRALQTAEIILEKQKRLKPIAEEGLSEIDYGDWVGKLFDEVAKQYPKEYDDYRFRPSKMKIPSGEAVKDVQARVVATVDWIRKRHEGQRVLIVSHADVIKALLGHLLGLPLDQLQKVGCDNGSLSVVRFGTEWGDRLVALNYFADIKKILPW